MKNKICSLLRIEKPIIQGGMVWVSGGRLAGAVSHAGGLGLIGAGSMNPDLLRQHILKAQGITDRPFGVNIPLLYKNCEKQIKIALDLGVRIFFTSAGSPKKFTSFLKDQGAVVVHVISTPLFAQKSQDAGVHAIVAEGFEAGGHNGREEVTTMALIPQVVDAVEIPVIAAGGIADGRQMAAAFCLGADAVQMGTRFLGSQESSAHENFKNLVLRAQVGSTRLSLKKHVPVRLLENAFAREIWELEDRGADVEELVLKLGKGRAKRGMLEGDIKEGELEVGQVASMIRHLPSSSEIIEEVYSDFKRLWTYEGH